MKKLMILALGLLLVMGLAGPAAASYTFEMGDDSSFTGNAFAQQGLTLKATMVDVSDYSFTLDCGESETFDFAYLKVLNYNQGDWWSKSITAHIVFDNPDLTAILGGDAQASINGTWNYVQDDTWSLIWEDALVFDLGGGQTMTVDLSDILGASVFYGGQCDPGDLVQLTVSYSCNPVPVPAALWLLGSGLVGLAGLRRKFR